MYTQIFILVLLLIAVLGSGWYWQTTNLPAAVEDTEIAEVYLEQQPVVHEKESDYATSSDPYEIYKPLQPMQIGEQPVQASLAITPEERRRGLSDTPSLPDDVVKVFVFPESKKWSFWMKDMNYAIDIIWVDAMGTVVHVVSEISPDTYPESFKTPQPARYVIETVAGFVSEHAIAPGAMVDLPDEL